jgi:hypothetical protein
LLFVKTLFHVTSCDRGTATAYNIVICRLLLRQLLLSCLCSPWERGLSSEGPIINSSSTLATVESMVLYGTAAREAEKRSARCATTAVWAPNQ